MSNLEAQMAVQTFDSKLVAGKLKIAVLGVGYVGWELCIAFYKCGLPVVGYDPSTKRLESLEQGGLIRLSCDASILEGADVFIIAVPTPLDVRGAPAYGAIDMATALVKSYIRPGCLVVLESTVAPGTTRTMAQVVGEQQAFYAYSPERINPGQTQYTLKNTPKLVGGEDHADGWGSRSGKVAATLYRQICDTVIECQSAAVAEAAKLLENTYRLVNIALVNQLKPVFQELNVDLNQVIDAASTKPFGFQAFRPGPGIGGHCIPVDPAYLLDWARQGGFDLPIVSAALDETEATAKHVADTVLQALWLKTSEPGNVVVGPMPEAVVLIVGIAYKPDVVDWRESPALRIAAHLRKFDVQIRLCDPLLPDKIDGKINYPLTAAEVRAASCVLVCCLHEGGVGGGIIERHAKLLVDTTGTLTGFNVIRS